MAEVTVTPSSVDIRPGETTTLSAAVTDAEGQPIPGESVTWLSSDPTIASVSADGILTAHEPGTVTITATADEVSDDAAISVLAPVAALMVEPGDLDLRRGRFTHLRTVLTDEDGNKLTGRVVAWTSSDPSVAVVDKAGRVDAVSDGQATIRAESEGVTGSSSIQVQSDGFLVVSTGGRHTCALALDGTAWCWGTNEHGQLGTGDYAPSTVPRPVAGGLLFDDIAAGDVYACGVTSTGQAYCWGDNAMWTLGNRTAGKDSNVPVPVLSTAPWAMIGTATWHACGLSTAQVVYCWGYNRFGPVGNGSVIDEPLPIPVVGGLSFQALAPGYFRTCGIATGGTVYCWGRGGRSQFGDPNASTEICHNFECRMSPTPVPDGRSYVSMAAGSMHTCAITTADRLYCWGDNAYGQLGDGTHSEGTTPTPVQSSGRFAQVSAGQFHSCGLLEDGSAVCWGRNEDGRLGNGTTADVAQPTAVAGVNRYVSLSASHSHTCGLATDGSVLCWGDNTSGQLGDGSTSIRLVPTRVIEP